MMKQPAAFATRVSAVQAALQTVRPWSEAEWQAALLQEPAPDEALTLWETVAFAYTAFFEPRTPTAKARDQALRVLLDYAAGCSEADIHRAAYKGLRNYEIRRLLMHYDAAVETVGQLRQRRDGRGF